MIVVLSGDPGLQSWWTRLRRRPSIREVSALGESIMLVHPGRDPNWPKLAQKLGRYASRVICGEDVELPKERPWKRLDNSKMKGRILCNTLCSFSESFDWVGLYDPEGRLCVLAWELAQHFPRVTVWCKFRERYQSLCGDLMEQLGAAVELTGVKDGLLGCPLIGAMEAPFWGLRWDGTLLLCGKTESPPITGQLRQNLHIPLPAELLEICPCDVDPMELYLGIMGEQRKEIPPDLCYNVLETGLELTPIEKFL